MEKRDPVAWRVDPVDMWIAAIGSCVSFLSLLSKSEPCFALLLFGLMTQMVPGVKLARACCVLPQLVKLCIEVCSNRGTISAACFSLISRGSYNFLTSLSKKSLVLSLIFELFGSLTLPTSLQNSLTRFVVNAGEPGDDDLLSLNDVCPGQVNETEQSVTLADKSTRRDQL